jgi:flagellar basal-body rod protein FlgB
MPWIESLFQRETLPVLDSAMGFAHQRQLAIANNIANVETPYYKRQTVPEAQFQEALSNAIEERRASHPATFEMADTWDIEFDEQFYPDSRHIDGREWGPERHDENSVVIEKEMADLAKNTLAIQTMQQLYRKKLGMLRSSLRDRVM